MELNHTPTLITGASRGLGAALARALAAQGARVVLAARHTQPLLDVVEQIKQRGGEAHALAFDVGHKEDLHRLAGAAAALVGPIDLLIHNASTLGPLPMPLLLDTACEDLEAVLQTNLVGPFRLTKVIAGSMAVRGRGLIVHLSSDAAVNAYPRWGAYGISKAALDHLSRSLAAELSELGVSSISIDPTEMDTRMHADAMPDADVSTLARPDDIAARMVSIIQRAHTLSPGARLVANAEVAA